MGTNYYWHPRDKVIVTCNQCDTNHLCIDKEIHIGKASAGWKFLYHITDEIKSVDDWKSVTSGRGNIIDEYGSAYSYSEFWYEIVDRSEGKVHSTDNYVQSDSEGNQLMKGEFS